MIQWSMDRKQEIQNQIAELQRELAGMEKGGAVIQFNDGFGGDINYAAVNSLCDEDIIQALRDHPAISDYAGMDVVIYLDGAKLNTKFHVTRNVSYNITPF